MEAVQCVHMLHVAAATGKAARPTHTSGEERKRAPRPWLPRYSQRATVTNYM